MAILALKRRRTPLRPALLAILALFLLAGLVLHRPGGSSGSGSAGLRQADGTVGGAAGRPVFKPLRALPSRNLLGAFLEQDGLKVGAELGVQHGNFAAHTLNAWPSCTRYYLVDLWGHQPNYHDIANVKDEEQENIMQEAKANLKAFEAKTVFLRNYTSDAAALIPDGSLDYIYVDARHDYCGVSEDLELYWPKLKPGGIFAGHDYVVAQDPLVLGMGQDWSVCMNGTKHDGAVRGAVDEFMAARGLLVVATTQDGGWESWMTRKPTHQPA